MVEGYRTFLENRAAHQKRCSSLLANILRERLFGQVTQLNLVDEIPLTRAAEHALIAIQGSGIDFMFDEHGNFKGMVT